MRWQPFCDLRARGGPDVVGMSKLSPELALAACRRLQVALVAHDNMKPGLLEWVDFNKGTLSRVDLIATGTTGKLVTAQTGLPVRLLLSGPLGGDQQVGALIATGHVDLLVFMIDPLETQPHDVDVKALLRLAGVWNIPIAVNRATADFLISSPLFLKPYDRQLPDYTSHNDRLASSS